MDGQQLWKAFLDAAVPTGDLKELGYDLFFARAHPHSNESARAVAALGKVLGILPEHAYHAFNTDPGRNVLQQLATDYNSRHFWANLAPSTSIYINRVAARVTIIKNASQKPPGTAGPAPKVAHAPTPPPAAAAPKSKVSTYVALAFTVLALNELVKAAAYRWQQRLIGAH